MITFQSALAILMDANKKVDDSLWDDMDNWINYFGKYSHAVNTYGSGEKNQDLRLPPCSRIKVITFADDFMMD